MTRPRGEIRQAVATAADMLVQQHGRFHGRALAQSAQVAFEKARLTLKDMVRAGELEVIGQEQLPGVCRPLNLYARPCSTAAASSSAAELTSAVMRWADFR
jgi:hypothetical protein